MVLRLEVENLAGFALFKAIEFDRLDDCLAEVIAVRIGHGDDCSSTPYILVPYVLTGMATAIFLTEAVQAGQNYVLHATSY